MFLQTLLLLFEEAGLAACPQAAWSSMANTLRAHFRTPTDQMVFCGVAIGYADENAPINTLQTRRDGL